jgi:Asp-tRNA(Asn)/Glu-tRNA(Gln) amidotransferase B subunit
MSDLRSSRRTRLLEGSKLKQTVKKRQKNKKARRAFGRRPDISRFAVQGKFLHNPKPQNKKPDPKIRLLIQPKPTNHYEKSTITTLLRGRINTLLLLNSNLPGSFFHLFFFRQIKF